ncbi:uncharacterized protein LOC125242274 isoform X1 [Leguminivora glycinivorella]|uniref:uncharacterized protein LOC125242274 isoform X1 n=1 Tax=Leguminivora glycinivorella TaxID=1035111 RepID=UPI00200D4361|nr:uncharacterized protein LOC125242274 isoform X1 [Leguminivora glycinivorella]XP_048006990.1 uncharacterized protein LOC125242274 isoform X1 [Leguminivora glycinivorella]XP_048006991.1 uncharacterized protein LOC125242274 isoform X1 [Leguminivora glycinivorella]
MWILIALLSTFITCITAQKDAKLNHQIMAEYNLIYPYEWRQGEFIDLEKMLDCYCPRVYWPCCSSEGVTYPNHCVLICDKKSLKRLGPCIKYRRDMDQVMTIVLPRDWKNTTRKDLEHVKPGDFIVERVDKW